MVSEQTGVKSYTASWTKANETQCNLWVISHSEPAVLCWDGPAVPTQWFWVSCEDSNSRHPRTLWHVCCIENSLESKDPSPPLWQIPTYEKVARKIIKSCLIRLILNNFPYGVWREKNSKRSHNSDFYSLINISWIHGSLGKKIKGEMCHLTLVLFWHPVKSFQSPKVWEMSNTL